MKTTFIHVTSVDQISSSLYSLCKFHTSYICALTVLPGPAHEVETLDVFYLAISVTKVQVTFVVILQRI